MCKVAQYCGQECQRWDFKDKHKFLCIQYFKPQKDLGEKAKKILNEKQGPVCEVGKLAYLRRTQRLVWIQPI